jgi:ABC-type hemin transport system ATPase subunit
LVYLNEPAANCDLKHIERLLNVGDSFTKEGLL